MSERIPRRMRRFYRKGEQPPEIAGLELAEGLHEKPEPGKKEEMNKQITMQLALDKVQHFKQEHKRLPKKEEYDRIAESIYKQLKDQAERKKTAERLEEKAERLAGKAEGLGEKDEGTKRKKHGLTPSERARLRRQRKQKGPKSKAKERQTAIAELEKADKSLSQKEIKGKSLSQKEIKGMSVEDLFGTEKSLQKKAAKPAEDEFSLGGLTDLEAGQEIGETQQNKCPKCQTITENIIFCPECGTAFCENCAKRVQAIGKTKTFVCPSCNAKIKK